MGVKLLKILNDATPLVYNFRIGEGQHEHVLQQLFTFACTCSVKQVDNGILFILTQ